MHNPLKVTATNYTPPKQTDAYPELDCALLHQKNIQGLHNHHLDDSNNMCVTHFFFTRVTKCMPSWDNEANLVQPFIFHYYALLSSVFRLACVFCIFGFPYVTEQARFGWMQGSVLAKRRPHYLGVQSVLQPAPNWAISALRGKRRDERVNYSNERAAMQRAVSEREARHEPCSVAPLWSVHD